MNLCFQYRSSSALLYQIAKRFKKHKPLPPRDPPPTSSLKSHNIHPDFDPFVSSSEYSSSIGRGGEWTKINHSLMTMEKDRDNMDENENELTTLSPDSLVSKSNSQVLPRTIGIPTIAKHIQQEPYKHQLKPENQIEIIAQDNSYIFVYKPAGIPCVPEYISENDDSRSINMMDIKKEKNKKKKNKNSKNNNNNKTFYEMFQEYWWKNYPFYRFQPRLLHKLDRDVSGIMVFGKRWCAEEHFLNLYQANPDYLYGCGVKKSYIAVCKGIPSRSEGLIEGMIKKAHWNYKRNAIYPHRGQKYVTKDMNTSNWGQTEDHIYVDNKNSKYGSHVRTEFRVVDTCDHGSIGICSLIIFTIHTGKTDQIRASAASLGTPIIGDVLYGGPKYSSFLLHSLFIGFEGVVDSDLLYGVSCLPKWTHLSNHFWSTKAQYYTQQHLDFLMNVPRPSKKNRVIQYSMRKERMALKRESVRGNIGNQLLIPFLKDNNQNQTKLLTSNNEDIENKNKKGLSALGEYIANNFIEDTLSDAKKRRENKRNRPKVYENKIKDDDKYDSLLDGAIPEHFMDKM